VDTRVRDEVGLELGNVDVQGTIETERSRKRGDDLSDETVQVGVGRAFDIEGTTADVVDSLVVKHNSNIGVLKKRVGRKNRVVRLNNSGGHLRRRVDGETELGLLAVVDGETLEEKGSETRSSSTSNSVEDKETLKTGAVIGKLSEAIECKVNNLLSDGVVTTGVVVGSVLLAGDQLLRVVELTVGTSADLVTDTRLKIDEHATGHVLASTSLREKGVEGVITAADGLVGRHLAIRLDAVLEAVKFPAGVTGLNTGLTYDTEKQIT
jgi:hypothetical protein